MENYTIYGLLLLSLSIIFPRFICAVVLISTSFLFIKEILNNMPLNVSTIFVYSFISWWTFELFLLFAYYEYCWYKCSCTSFCVTIYFQNIWVCANERNTESYDNFEYNFLRNYQTIFQNSHTTLHSHQQYKSSNISISVSTLITTCLY